MTDSFHYDDGSPFHGIFREIRLTGQYMKEYKPPVYTIAEEDDDLPSAHKIYMASQTEYDAAIAMVGSWPFWKNMLKASSKIRAVVEDWREEKMLMDQSKAKEMLWEAAQKGNASAQRILYESKKEERAIASKQKKANIQAEKETAMIQDRLDRLTDLKVVN